MFQSNTTADASSFPNPDPNRRAALARAQKGIDAYRHTLRRSMPDVLTLGNFLQDASFNEPPVGIYPYSC